MYHEREGKNENLEDAYTEYIEIAPPCKSMKSDENFVSLRECDRIKTMINSSRNTIPRHPEHYKQIMGISDRVKETVKRILTDRYDSIEQFMDYLENYIGSRKISVDFIEYRKTSERKFSKFRWHESMSFSAEDMTIIDQMQVYDHATTQGWDILFLLPYTTENEQKYMLIRLGGVQRKYQKDIAKTVIQEYDRFIANSFQNILDINTDTSITWLRNTHSLHIFIKNHPPEKVREKKERYVVCALDMNAFKRINDEYGHYVGDIALKVFSHILRRSITRSNDIIFRKWGDEFVIFAKISQPGDEFLTQEQILSKNTLSKKRIREKIEANLTDESGITSFLSESEKNALTLEHIQVLSWLSATIGTSIMDGSSSWESALNTADDDLRLRKSDDGTVHRLIRGIKSLDDRGPHFREYIRRLQEALGNKKGR